MLKSTKINRQPAGLLKRCRQSSYAIKPIALVWVTIVAALTSALFINPAFTTTITLASDFTDNNDGTVTHKLTNLTWQRCKIGQTWSGSSCVNSSAIYPFDSAISASSHFAGFDDWRPPTDNELNTFIEFKIFNPTAYSLLFPDTPGLWFWAASSGIGNSDNEWFMFVSDASDNFHYERNSVAVRLVRGGESTNALPSAPVKAAADCLFNRAEKNYAIYLSPIPAESKIFEQYYFRYYSGTNAYLGISMENGHVYYIGPDSGAKLLDLGEFYNLSSVTGCS